jgi:hypothetical protein
MLSSIIIIILLFIYLLLLLVLCFFFLSCCFFFPSKRYYSLFWNFKKKLGNLGNLNDEREGNVGLAGCCSIVK